MMQPPGFWQNPPDKPGFSARALMPLSYLWQALSNRRMAKGTWARVPVPVICVGNITIGGSGKTPTVIALSERLQKWGWTPHVVSRGYGGSLSGPLKVNEHGHTAQDVGDEPLLLAAFCPTWIAHDRFQGALAAVADGADVILLDDGFQNPAIAKDMSIVVVDGVAGFGNKRIIPSGPLREPVGAGLERADILLTIGHPKARAGFERALQPAPDVGRADGELRPLETGIEWKGMKVFAFAGIGRPEKFFATLKSLGADIMRAKALADHQPLTLTLMRRLENESFFRGAQMVTTEKDAIRLPEEFKLRVLTVPVRLHIEDWSPIDAALAIIGVVPKHQEG